MAAEALAGMAKASSAALLEARHDQVFPLLSPEEIARLQRFGRAQHWVDGARMLETGTHSPGTFVVLSGSVSVTRRDGHGHDVPIVTHGPGSFTGEVGQLSEARSLVDAVAVGEVNTLLITPTQ